MDIAWSQPVTFANGAKGVKGANGLLKKIKDMVPSGQSKVKTFSLCHASTRLGSCEVYTSAQARDVLSNLEGGRGESETISCFSLLLCVAEAFDDRHVGHPRGAVTEVFHRARLALLCALHEDLFASLCGFQGGAMHWRRW